MTYDTAIVTCTIIVEHIAVTISVSIVAVENISIAENSLPTNIAVDRFFVSGGRMKPTAEKDEKINAGIDFRMRIH